MRERVGILDATAFAKFDLVGPGAAAVLDHLTTNTVPDVGRIGLTYTDSIAAGAWPSPTWRPSTPSRGPRWK